MGGIIKDKYHQDVERIIDDEPFNGDRDKFLAEVKKGNYYETLQRSTQKDS